MPTQPTTRSIITQLQAYDANDRTEDLLQQPSTQSVSPNKVLDMIQRVERIKLPSKVVDKYTLLQRHPSALWSSAGIQLDPIKTNEQMEAFFSDVYLGASKLTAKHDKGEIIVRRFFALFFYDLVHFSKPIWPQLVDLLSSSSSIQDERTIIESNIRRWVKSGTRHSRFSESLGLGAPFLLPRKTETV
jgi:hypothetical protein